MEGFEVYFGVKQTRFSDGLDVESKEYKRVKDDC